MSKIFISYRREDSADMTGRIFDRLDNEFGKGNVFMDVTSIPYGTHYPIHILEQVAKCEVFLAVIGQNWMQNLESTGKARLDDPKDLVRIEVEVALSRPILVIPVLVSGASFPTADQLPATMRELSYRHGSQVRSGADFHPDMNRLIEVLKQQVQGLINEQTEPSTVGETVVKNVKEDASSIRQERCITASDEKHLQEPMKAKRRIRRKPANLCLCSDDPRQEVPFEMVKVAKGAFLYGDDKAREVIDYDYWINRYPVTNKKYAIFIAAGGYDNQQYWSLEGWQWKTENNITMPASWEDAELRWADHPIVGVSYYEAEAYAKWAGKRLPTEREWEKAARGNDGRKYPWGDQFDENACNGGKLFLRSVARTFSSSMQTTPVTKYPSGVSPCGCYDMTGNVSEWCADWYDEKKESRVLRGGSWGNLPVDLRASSRYWSFASSQYDFVGFRPVQDIP
jgi:formylglycine-generating enzyme required for sulfatase activity